MALTATTLNGAITNSVNQIVLTSATGIAKKMLVRVDNEFMLVTDVSLSPTIAVVRGYSNDYTSSSALAHGTLALVCYGVPGDFSQVNGTAAAAVTSYSISGAITVPLTDQKIEINDASAAALTLGAPLADTTPRIIITSASAAAHTVTAVTLLADGTSTTLKSTATFGPHVGATLELLGVNGVWNVCSVENVALA